MSPRPAIVASLAIAAALLLSLTAGARAQSQPPARSSGKTTPSAASAKGARTASTPAIAKKPYSLTPIVVPAQGTTIAVPWTVYSTAAARTAPDPKSPKAFDLLKGAELLGDLVRRDDTGTEWLEVTRDGAKAYVSTSVLYRVHPANRVAGNIPIGMEVATRWWGMPLDYEPTDLAELPDSMTDGRPMRLRQEARDAMVELITAARKDGVKLHVFSSYRSGEKQRELYNRAIANDLAQRHTAPPGHSEHQLGTTVDIEDAAGLHRLSRSFDKTREGKWLQQNAHTYGWIQSYTGAEIEKTGYIAEAWHFRYWGVERAAAIRKERTLESPRVAKGAGT